MAPRRRYQIVEVPPNERKKKTIYSFEKQDGVEGLFTREVPPTEREFDVFMASGASVRLTHSRLRKLELDKPVQFFDEETGETIPIQDVLLAPLDEELVNAKH